MHSNLPQVVVLRAGLGSKFVHLPQRLTSSAHVLNCKPDKDLLSEHGLPLLCMVMCVINMAVKQSRSKISEGQRSVFSIELGSHLHLSLQLAS